jgi:Cys-rich four helix bundle protein (predicted Tat secretion target)
MIIAAGALAAAAAAPPAARAAGEADHAHHHAGGAVNRPLLTAMYDGVATGQICIRHCLETLKAGDTTLAACLASVEEMVATCTAAGELTALQSPFLKDMLKVSLQVCQACETECRKHADRHAECKACAEACVNCITQIRAALAT